MIVSRTSAASLLGKTLESAWPKGSRKRSYYLLSSAGDRNLGGPYKTKKEAQNRERQVQYFKNKPESEVSADMKNKKSKDAEKIKRSVSSRKNPGLLDGLEGEDTGRQIEDIAIATNGEMVGRMCDPSYEDVFLIKYDRGDRTFYVRAERSGFAGNWEADVFEAQRTPFLSQLIEREDLVPMLKSAVKYMPYLGTPDKYIPDPDRLTVTDLIYKWAEWYAGYRLLPWMSFKGWYDNPLHEICRDKFPSEDEYFYEHAEARGPYVPQVGYEYDDGMASIRYPIERGETVNADQYALLRTPWEAHIRMVCKNEESYANWITEDVEDGGGYRTIIRPDVLTSTANLLGNLEGPLSPLGSFFDKKAGGLTYYWRGTVDYGKPPGKDVVSEAEEEERLKRLGAGLDIEGAVGVESDIPWIPGLSGEPVTMEERREMDEGLDDEFFLDEPQLYSNPSPSAEGFLPGFTYRVFPGEDMDDVEMQLVRYYARPESRRYVGTGNQFIPATTPTITAVSVPFRSMWETIGFAHETLLLKRSPGTAWERGGAPTEVTRAQRKERSRVAPYQQGDEPTKNPRELRGQQVDYLEFYVEAVDFTRPLTWVKSSVDLFGLGGPINEALSRAARMPRPNPSAGIWQERRGLTKIPNILKKATKMFASTSVVNYDKIEKQAAAENASRGIDSDIPGAAFPDPVGNICKDGNYYQAKREDDGSYRIVYAIGYEGEGRRGENCYLVRDSIKDGASGEDPEAWRYASKNYSPLDYNETIFFPGPDESFVYLDLEPLARLPWVEEEGVLEDFLEEIELGQEMPQKRAAVQWVKPGGERKANVRKDQPERWYAWVQLPSGAGMEFPMEDLMWELIPYSEDGTKYYWDRNLLLKPGVDFSSDERDELTESWGETMFRKRSKNPSRNPCLGLHVHSDDLDKVKSLVETRQNPGFVSRVVKKHRKLEG